MIIFKYKYWEEVGFVLNTILVISYSFPLPRDYKYPPNIPKLKLQPQLW